MCVSLLTNLLTQTKTQSQLTLRLCFIFYVFCKHKNID